MNEQPQEGQIQVNPEHVINKLTQQIANFHVQLAMLQSHNDSLNNRILELEEKLRESEKPVSMDGGE